MEKAGVLTVTAGGTVPELRRLAPELSPQLPSGALNAIQFRYSVAGRGGKVNNLYYQHGVAEAVKAVVEFHGLFVGFEDKVFASKGGDEHEQGGFGEVEIGNHNIADAKLIAGKDE